MVAPLFLICQLSKSSAILASGAEFDSTPIMDIERCVAHQSEFVTMNQWPNQSPEPTAVGAGRSAVAVHAASRRWLSFFR